jgi:hypothetical protein
MHPTAWFLFGWLGGTMVSSQKPAASILPYSIRRRMDVASAWLTVHVFERHEIASWSNYLGIDLFDSRAIGVLYAGAFPACGLLVQKAIAHLSITA